MSCYTHLVTHTVAAALEQSDLIADRTYHLISFKKCFVGSEFVDWVIKERTVNDRPSAIVLGQQMLKEGHFHHVTSEHGFEDEYFFYRLFDDDDMEYLTREAHKARQRPSWNMRTDVPCASCQQSFNQLRRRHHCRQCGEVVCHSCSSHSCPLPFLGYDSRVRVCKTCYPHLRPESGGSEADGSGDNDDVVSTFEPTLTRRFSQSSESDGAGTGSISRYPRARDFLRTLPSNCPEERASDSSASLTTHNNCSNYEKNGIEDDSATDSRATIFQFESDYLSQKEKVAHLFRMITSYNAKASKMLNPLSLDVEHVLMFLRARKFNCIKALNRMIKFHTHPYTGAVCNALNLERELSSNALQVLNGKDIHGRAVMIVRLAQIDVLSQFFDLEKYRISLLFLLRQMLKDPATQINGMVLILDFKAVVTAVLRRVTRGDIKRTIETVQGVVPMRVEQIFVLHCYKTLIEVARPFLTHKMNKRIVMLDRIDQLHQYIDKRFLPIDFGGDDKQTAKEWLAHVAKGGD
eukprot:c8831_g1_i1.p1 GENE.c8831_g1_i1~~c8831_g1_i1.p1  ORF type:complete len:520 (+),score=125.48 c8831_g1_i1:14-1573(+)